MTSGRSADSVRAYADWLNVDLCFQDFEDGACQACQANTPPPTGVCCWPGSAARFRWLRRLRPLEDDICEMKRLWVEPGFLGLGIGRKLAEAIVDRRPRSSATQTMRLDTMPERLKAAGHIYETLGFKEIPDYYHNPLDGVVMYEL